MKIAHSNEKYHYCADYIYVKTMIAILFSDVNHGDISFIVFYSKALRYLCATDWYNVSS